MLTYLNHALKEWNVAIKALEKGETILLLRKGGIREVTGQFEVKYNPILLYPTYEHQKPNLLKADYRTSVIPVKSGWHPDKIQIQSWAKITNIFQVHNKFLIDSLFPYHIWTEEFIEERLRQKPKNPLFLLLLRVYLLPQPIVIPYHSNYSGCRSWIQLETSIDTKESQAVFTEMNYQEKLSEIQQKIRNFSEHP